jgi:hypothetical protein
MRLNEIKAEAAVTISVAIGLQILEFNTVAKEVYDDRIFCEPITKDDKMVGFSTKGLVLSMIVADAEEGKAFKFSNVKIRNIKTQNGNLFHEVSCKTEGKLINRRGACRVWLGEDGVAIVGLGGKPFDVTIKDISISGIAFICSKDQQIPDGSIVHLTFFDEPTNSKFSLGALIVRSEEMEKNRMMYGCRLNQESPAIAKFVNEKQREKLKASRQVRNQSLAEGDNNG